VDGFGEFASPIHGDSFYGKPTIHPSGYRNRRGEDTSSNAQLANFDDNEGHVVGEGSVAPGSNAVEDCPLHFRQCQRRRFVNQVFQTLHAEQQPKSNARRGLESFNLNS